MNTFRVPIFTGDGLFTAWALIDEQDAFIVFKRRWHLSDGGYPESGRNLLMHKLIMRGRTGHGLVVDHINRDKLDNRRCNLRAVTPKQNARNLSGRSEWRGRPASSPFRGVSWSPTKNKWRAHARTAGKQIHLGYFKDEASADQAVQKFWNSLDDLAA